MREISPISYKATFLNIPAFERNLPANRLTNSASGLFSLQTNAATGSNERMDRYKFIFIV